MTSKENERRAVVTIRNTLLISNLNNVPRCSKLNACMLTIQFQLEAICVALTRPLPSQGSRGTATSLALLLMNDCINIYIYSVNDTLLHLAPLSLRAVNDVGTPSLRIL